MSDIVFFLFFDTPERTTIIIRFCSRATGLETHRGKFVCELGGSCDIPCHFTDIFKRLLSFIAFDLSRSVVDISNVHVSCFAVSVFERASYEMIGVVSLVIRGSDLIIYHFTNILMARQNISFQPFHFTQKIISSFPFVSLLLYFFISLHFISFHFISCISFHFAGIMILPTCGSCRAYARGARR